MKRKGLLVLLVVCVLLIMTFAGTGSGHAQSSYTLSLTVEPAGDGTTVPSAGDHSYPEGTTVSVLAVPEPDRRFLAWDGPNKTECQTGSVVMDADKSCTAVFGEKVYWLSVSPSPSWGGIVTKVPDLVDGYADGTAVTVNAVAESGWQFDGWSGRDAAACAAGPIEMHDDAFCIANFSQPFPPPPNKEHWMADVALAIQDRRLKDVVLPGSHDAGTYDITEDGSWIASGDLPPFAKWLEELDIVIGKIPRYYAAIWSRTQSRDIYGQLEGGIRYFDLRFFRSAADDEVYIYHGFFRGDTTRDDVLDDVERFLNEEGHEKEIIILDLTKWSGMGDLSHRMFISEILARFKDKMIPEEDWDKPLSEIWDSGQQLVVKYEDLDHPSLVTPPSDYHLFWTDNETTLFTVDSVIQPFLDQGYMPSTLRLMFSAHGFPDNSAYIVEVIEAGSRWQITFEEPCSETFDVREVNSEELAIIRQDNVLCRPWAETFERGELKDRFRQYLDYGCCSADCDPDEATCECPSACSGSTCNKLFALPGLLTPDAEGALTKCGIASEIWEWLDDNSWYCAIPFVGPAYCGALIITAEVMCDSSPLNPAPRSLWELVMAPTSISSEVADWSSEWWMGCKYNARENMNIIHVDFFAHSNLVQTAIDINKGVYNDKPAIDNISITSGSPNHEGAPVTLTVDFGDKDTCDHHTVSIDWGNGASEFGVVDQGNHTATSGTVYADNGSYIIKVCVQDGVAPVDGYAYTYSEDCDTLPIVVQNVAPTVDAGLDQVIYEGDEVKLDPATFTDPGFDCLGCTPPTEENFGASIDWGDGSAIERVPPANLHETPGSYNPSTGVTVRTAGAVKGNHQYLAGPGVYPVTVCVWDDDGAKTCDSLEVIVVHGFMRFCAYADDENHGVIMHKETLAACGLVPTGVEGEMRPGGVGSRGDVDINEQTAVESILLSLSGKINVGQDAAVSGMVTAGDDVTAVKGSSIGGDITSHQRVDIKQNAIVYGNITAVDKIKVDERAAVYGDVKEYASVPLIPAITWINFAIDAGTEDVTVHQETNWTLVQGAYRDLKVGSGATLTIPSGQYAFRRITVEKGGTLLFDLPGDGDTIIVDVAEKLLIKQDVQMIFSQDANGEPTGVAQEILFRIGDTEQGDDVDSVQLHSGGSYLGTFLAPNSNVQLGDGARLEGALYGRKVKVEQRATIIGKPALDLFVDMFVRK